MSSTTYPDGTILVSDALTLDQINSFMFALTQQALGQPVDPNSGLIRIEYPADGAPFAQNDQDVCYLSCMSENDPYNRIRDRVDSPNDEQFLTETWTYTRSWRIHWCFYGPNSMDSARMLRSAMYQDYFTNQLQDEQLFPVSDIPEPVRAPEIINKQWFERVDLNVEMYEFVTETISRQTVLSTEVIVEVPTAKIADITVEA
jgi:hypothetical protein